MCVFEFVMVFGLLFSWVFVFLFSWAIVYESVFV